MAEQRLPDERLLSTMAGATSVEVQYFAPSSRDRPYRARYEETHNKWPSSAPSVLTWAVNRFAIL